MKSEFSFLKILIVTVIAAPVTVLFLLWYQDGISPGEGVRLLWGMFAPERELVVQEKEVVITEQEQVYGIGGEVLEIRENAIAIETPALALFGMKPSIDERWIWVVVMDADTNILKLEGIDENEVPIAATMADIQIGNVVAVTSTTDISKEFSLDERTIVASEIALFVSP